MAVQRTKVGMETALKKLNSLGGIYPQAGRREHPRAHAGVGVKEHLSP